MEVRAGGAMDWLSRGSMLAKLEGEGTGTEGGMQALDDDGVVIPTELAKRRRCRIRRESNAL
jgi:hypothetical protein